MSDLKRNRFAATGSGTPVNSMTPGNMTPGNMTPGNMTPGSLTPGNMAQSTGTPGHSTTPGRNTPAFQVRGMPTPDRQTGRQYMDTILNFPGCKSDSFIEYFDEDMRLSISRQNIYKFLAFRLIKTIN